MISAKRTLSTRLWPTVALGLIGSVAHCQTPGIDQNAGAPTDPNELTIFQAYQKLYNDNNIGLTLMGTQTIGTTTTRIESDLWFSMSVDPRTKLQTLAKIHLDEYQWIGKTQTLFRQYIGDGVNLWFYDRVNHQYSTTLYGFYGTTNPNLTSDPDVFKMLAQLNAVERGPALYMIRMLREINPSLTTRYQTWAPGEVTMQPLTEPPTQDPLFPSRSYSTSSGEQWVLYGPPPIDQPNYYKIKPRRSVAFRIDNTTGPDTPDWELTEIDFAEQRANQFTNWTITVSVPPASSIAPPTYNAANLYVPYTTAQLVGYQPVEVTHRLN